MKLLSLVACFLFMVFSVNAQSIKRKNVPEKVLSALKIIEKSPVEEKWEKVKGGYKVKFKNETGESLNVKFSDEGQWLKTKKKLKPKPQVIKKYVVDNYEGYELKKVEEVTQPEKALYYKAWIKGDKDEGKLKLKFDKEQKFVKVYKKK